MIQLKKGKIMITQLDSNDKINKTEKTGNMEINEIMWDGFVNE